MTIEDSMKNDGGPAFPPMHNPETHESGMSLRDWFAGQALISLVAASLAEHGAGAKMVGTVAYQIADAMLEARK